MKTNGRFSILTTLIVLLIYGTSLVADAQLFDGEREGFLLGTGVGFAAAASGGNGGSATGFAVSGKIGYGMSDQMAIYFSSPVPSIMPSIADGKLVRTLELGHQPVGIYQDKNRAAYWDRRNALGEPVASDVCFCTLTADEFATTRKMLIKK